jgi:anti-sigma B factor antagonist
LRFKPSRPTRPIGEEKMRIANVASNGPAGAVTIVVVTGRVTVDSSPHLRAVLQDAIGAGLGGVTVDFTAASYLDTSAVATLLEAATLASQRRVALRVIGLHGDARVVVESVELDRIFPALGYEVQFA